MVTLLKSWHALMLNWSEMKISSKQTKNENDFFLKETTKNTFSRPFFVVFNLNLSEHEDPCQVWKWVEIDCEAKSCCHHILHVHCSIILVYCFYDRFHENNSVYWLTAVLESLAVILIHSILIDPCGVRFFSQWYGLLIFKVS